MLKVICFHLIDEPNGFLSNWYPSEFEDENKLRYVSMEQYMMYRKALLFNDEKTAEKILKAEDPSEIKALGREITGFDEALWGANKYSIVYSGVLLKFTQNEELKEKLLSFGTECIFAECAVNDKVWGIGLSMTDPDRLYPDKWHGENLLGKALTQVRDELAGK